MKYVAFLRAINVGGHAVIKMSEIRKIFQSIGFGNVQTFIASGNVIFESKSTPTSTLEKRIESAFKKELGYEVGTLVRTEKEVREIATFMPFRAKDVQSALILSITFLREPLSKEAQEKLMSLKSDLDHFHLQNRELYWLSKTKFSDSKVAAKVSRILGDHATARGVKTVKQIAEKYCLLLDSDDL